MTRRRPRLRQGRRPLLEAVNGVWAAVRPISRPWISRRAILSSTTAQWLGKPIS